MVPSHSPGDRKRVLETGMEQILASIEQVLSLEERIYQTCFLPKSTNSRQAATESIKELSAIDISRCAWAAAILEERQVN